MVKLSHALVFRESDIGVRWKSHLAIWTYLHTLELSKQPIWRGFRWNFEANYSQLISQNGQIFIICISGWLSIQCRYTFSGYRKAVAKLNNHRTWSKARVKRQKWKVSTRSPRVVLPYSSGRHLVHHRRATVRALPLTSLVLLDGLSHVRDQSVKIALERGENGELQNGSF